MLSTCTCDLITTLDCGLVAIAFALQVLLGSNICRGCELQAEHDKVI